MVNAGLAIDAVMASVDKGLVVASAQRILEKEAQQWDQDPRISAQLRKIAAALPEHPTPAKVCRAHEFNFNESIRAENFAAHGVTAVQMVGAAEAFGRAAEQLESQKR